ncbi:hypothetical protein K6Q96_06890 [Grimontia kaedaensis]|uniref:Uncharacterized protein n=1 Tax=Grimontia kaedaensis TaxID=2872157 RepID=A0ABY4WXL2_9GAMM|nr:hypothetical protein [Grimontia kaedaensis]USH03713.1 hypothetical protein K6Q96_06890 [Grimontia kaedaensis]
MKFHGVGRHEYRVTLTLGDLESAQQIACAHGGNGRIFLVPMLGGAIADASSGRLRFSVLLAGVKEDIPNGVVDLATTTPANYEKPSWSGLADKVQVDIEAPLAGIDAVQVIIERW